MRWIHNGGEILPTHPTDQYAPTVCVLGLVMVECTSALLTMSMILTPPALML